MAAEVKKEIQLEIAHVLFTDIVGYSKLPIHHQRAVVERLNEIVRGTDEFQAAETAGRLIKIPTGDGITLVFYHSPEAPVECALEISRALKQPPEVQLRMGIHSGPVSGVIDATGKANVAGAGINIAQRVMDCGDAGHILLSKHVAEDLEEYPHWQPHLHELGECEVKHGLRVSLVNLYTAELGNPAMPEKLKAARLAATARRKKAAFRWMSFSLVSLLVVIAVIGFILFRYRRPVLTVVSPAPEKSIAVLPFENLSDEKQTNSHITEGVQDEILTDLAKVADLKVISRSSVMRYRKRAERNLREIAKELGVAHVVEGTVQIAGSRLRVTAQLIDARSDMHLWAERYDRNLADVFAVESELAEAIAGQLKAKLSPDEKAAIEERPTGDLAAYDRYARAKTLMGAISFDVRAEDNFYEAARLLNEAVSRDPSFLLAYSELAHAHDQIYFIGADHTPSRLELANRAIKNAFQIRPKSGEAHLALARHLYYGYRDYDGARSELAAARRNLPNDSSLMFLAGNIERRQGNWEESMQNLKRALELDPRNLTILHQISLTYRSHRRFRDMAATLDRALQTAPRDIPTTVQRVAIDLEEQANPKPLHSALQAIMADNPDAAETLADSRIELALCERDEAAAKAALAMTTNGCQTENFPFPHSWCEGVVARAFGDVIVAHAAFLRARTEVEKIVQEQRNYAEALCVLGTINAALGYKQEAIDEGQRAVDLLPLTKDSINGAEVLKYLALIYSWTGEKDSAIQQLNLITRVPSGVTYGQLRLHPYWDPLRGDARFEAIVASLAPKKS